MLRPWLLTALLSCALTAVAADLTPAETARARKLYAVKCAKCHKFYEPKNYSAADWEKWINLMSRKSKLKPADETLLKEFLAAYRGGKLPSPNKR